ncbi:GpE family phage tail protein [Candidatus Symbiopectobacterium endolongispinus]|nr:GpE family phage tail protein [Candidatus Symbiopectobacterium sp. PLON1]MBT9429520.1 GpE family phage tail protein [Candidatus Symbiopectobacterium endolongispinus]
MLFDQIDDLVADIAVVFNWPPSELFSMDLGEVIAWREQAAIRSGARDDEKPLYPCCVQRDRPPNPPGQCRPPECGRSD